MEGRQWTDPAPRARRTETGRRQQRFARLRGSDAHPVGVIGVVEVIILGVGVRRQYVRLIVIQVVRAAATGDIHILKLPKEVVRVDMKRGYDLSGGDFIAGGAWRHQVFRFANPTQSRKVALQLGGFGVERPKPPREEEGGLVVSVHLRQIGERMACTGRGAVYCLGVWAES